ncbi:MAG: tRNA glutamyl-Q(34) synthetase GluQRS [Microthrixaceae bacterium]
MTIGRFAPSPTGSLHLGNLRTALIAWCCARIGGGQFLVRMEDLTTGAAPVAEAEQLDDLRVLGIDHDAPVTRQSDRAVHHHDVLAQLEKMGVTYPCFCSRREIREATVAPHGPDPTGVYPGTCAELTEAQRRDRLSAVGRAATRIRAHSAVVTFNDRLNGTTSATVDDFVLSRADGVVAYNLAVVVDDAAAGVDQVVRGDDLLETTHRQVYLQTLLGLRTPEYVHVPLVLGPDGARLSKRHGAVGLRDQLDRGADPEQVLALLANSVDPLRWGHVGRTTTADVLGNFDLESLPRTPWVFDPGQLTWC